MRNNFIEALVGAFVLCLSGFFLYFAYSSNEREGEGAYVVSAIFDRIDGLNIGGDVKISGVKIGTIQSATLDPNTYQAKVLISIRKDIKLPDDSSAEVASESLLGGKYIAIMPGGSEEFLPKGGVITNTQSSISFEGLISKFLFSQSEPQKSKEKKDEPPSQG